MIVHDAGADEPAVSSAHSHHGRLDSALEQASHLAGLIPAATSVAEFFERLGGRVELTEDDEAGFVTNEEADQLVIEMLTARRAAGPDPRRGGGERIQANEVAREAEQGAEAERLDEIRASLIRRAANDSGTQGPCALVALWDQHVGVNDGSASAAAHEAQVMRISGLPSALEARLDRHIVCVVDGLGSDVSGALFSGPEVNTVLIARHQHVDPVHQVFAVFHMVMHGLLGHVRCGFDYRLEFVPGTEPSALREELAYIDEEQDADDAATCMMTAGYADSAFLMDFAARTRSAAGLRTSEIRAALHNRHRMLYAIARRLQTVTPSVIHALIDPPTVYKGTLGIATAPGFPLYVLQRVDAGDTSLTFRRWIPSRKVLHALGAENLPTDVVILTREELLGFPEGPMLINPIEVSAAKRYLLNTAAQLKIAPGAGRDRLAGLTLGDGAEAEGLWPNAREFRPMPWLTPQPNTLWSVHANARSEPDHPFSTS